MELEVRNIPDGHRAAVIAACAWGLQTLLHALSIAARESGTRLAEFEGDLTAVERTKDQVEQMLEEARRECGDEAPVELLVHAFTRRVFTRAAEYLDRHGDL